MRYLSTEIESVVSENVQAKPRKRQFERTLSQQDGQHKAENKAMIAAKNDLPPLNDEHEAEIENLQNTIEESEEALSQQINQFQVQVQMLNADKDALFTQSTQCETEIHGLKAAKGYLLGQVAQCKGPIDDLESAKSELPNQNTRWEVKIPSREAEKAESTDRDEENKSQFQTLSRLIRMRRSVRKRPRAG